MGSLNNYTFVNTRKFLKHFYFSFQSHNENKCRCVHNKYMPKYNNQFLGSISQHRNFITFSSNNRKRTYNGRQLVGYTMNQMFEVVSDVESYHKFVPWCKKSIVLKKTPGHLKADLVIGFPPINECYTSNVTLIKPYSVKAECTDGKLFHYMLTLWRFSPGLKREPNSCVVDFNISFEFRSAIHSQLSNLFFDQVAKQMEGAFIKEVGKRHGPTKIEPIKLINEERLKS